MWGFLIAALLGAVGEKSALPVQSFNMLDNSAPVLEKQSVAPFWRRTKEGLEQPIAAYGPMVDEIVIRGTSSGPAVVVLRDSSGREFRREVQGDFSWSVGADAVATGQSLEPRLTIVLPFSAHPVAWSELQVLVPLPAPGADELAELVASELTRILGWWTTLGQTPQAPRTLQLALGMWRPGSPSRTCPVGITSTRMYFWGLRVLTWPGSHRRKACWMIC